jgi:hypothetical protein
MALLVINVGMGKQQKEYQEHVMLVQMKLPILKLEAAKG